MADFSDEKFMEQFAASGREADFIPLFRRYFARLFRTARFLLRSSAEAEDAAQECFLRILHARKDYRTGSAFAPWIFTILRNICIDKIRQKSAHEHHSIHEMAELSTPPSTSLETRELLSRFQEGLEKMEETERIIISLRIHNGFGYREIAEVVGISEEAVKKRAYRALAELRKDISL